MSANIKAYLLNKPESREDYPFGGEVAVFKVCDKMFATYVEGGRAMGGATASDCARMNLKCDPDEALMLRDVFDAVLPGYHMNKKHWNTVVLDGSIPQPELERMIDRSYGLVVKKLAHAQRQRLEIQFGVEVIYR